jgi:CubicO group peptidase (beta-lactamase class C family)
MGMADVQGIGFEAVRELLQASIDSGDDAGVSLCAIHDGQTVVDLWGGLADIETGAPWQRDTIVNTFSLTKTMVALVALLLIDRNELDPDSPVTRYWPEFGAAGKDGVLVRHLLGHTSGLPGWQQPVTMDDVCDVPKATALLAGQEPWWRPGDGSGYQAMNHGHLVGELVSRITGSSLGTVFAAEFAGPDKADYYIGTPESADDRIARLISPPEASADWSRIPAGSVMHKTLRNPVLDIAKTSSRLWRGAELGAMNGHGNARSVATLQARISHGDPIGARIFDVQSDRTDRVLGLPIRFGLGYGLTGGVADMFLPAGRICWWSGYGGSLVVNDLDRNLTVAYVMNKMAPALVSLARATKYLTAIYAELA